MLKQIGKLVFHIYIKQSRSDKWKIWRRKKRALKQCVVCTKRITKRNPWTGKHYSMCEKHRLRANYLRKIANRKLNK